MKSLKGWFNLYFILALAGVAVGCHSSHHPHYGKKQVATVRLFLETHEPATAATVYVTRQRIPMTVEREPILDESDLAHARLVDEADGTYAIDLVFNEHGAAVLDMTSVANRGRRLAIFSHFPPPGTKEDMSDSPDPQAEKPAAGKPRKSGWISAVTITGRLTGGSLVFTPDASRDEAQAIVLGLNNVIAKQPKD